MTAGELNAISWEHFLHARCPEAIAAATEALALARAATDKQEEATALNNLGNVYYVLADYSKALEHYRRALEFYEEIGNKADAAMATCNMGNIYQDLSDYAKALEYYSCALKLNEELDNKVGMAMDIGNIGTLYYSLLDYPKALKYYSRALVFDEELGDKRGVARHTGNIGAVYSKISDYQKALEYYGRALALYEELGLYSGVADNTGNIGNIHYSLLNYPEALKYYSRAWDLHKELGNKAGVAANIVNIGNLYATEDFEGYDADKAEEYLLKAKEINEELGLKAQNITVFKTLAQLCEQQKRWQEAYTHCRKHYELKEEVQSEEVRKQAERFDYERKTAEREKHLAVERARAQAIDDILANIPPPNITERLLKGEKKIADTHENVSVLFVDIVNFTQLSEKLSAEELIDLLDIIFTRFDVICKNHGLEKIKTIGDAYMAVCGAPAAVGNHVERAAKAALEMLEEFSIEREFSAPVDLGYRIGLHSGRVVAGIIGENKYSYDLWGDTVNTASRMEHHGEAGRIHVSEAFKNAVEKLESGVPLHFEERGEIDIKGKGIMRTFFLEKQE